MSTLSLHLEELRVQSFFIEQPTGFRRGHRRRREADHGDGRAHHVRMQLRRDLPRRRLLSLARARSVAGCPL